MSGDANGSIEVVFCAIDFSQTADLALENSIRLARRHQASLVLGHVVEPLPVVSYPILMVPVDAEVELRELASARLEELAGTIRDRSDRDGQLVVETRLEQGPPGRHLVDMAEQAGADVFVIGTRGLTGFEHLLLGSTAEYVVRRASCPVLTVHPTDLAADAPVGTVIVPTDLGPESIEAVDVFVRVFAGAERPLVLLVFADPTPPYIEPFQHQALERWGRPDVRKEEIDERMAPSVARLAGAGFEVETLILDGGPVEAVTKLAQAREVDMIVMTTYGRSVVANLLVGRTAQRIVQHAPCPVLTVHASGSRDEGDGGD